MGSIFSLDFPQWWGLGGINLCFASRRSLREELNVSLVPAATMDNNIYCTILCVTQCIRYHLYAFFGFYPKCMFKHISSFPHSLMWRKQSPTEKLEKPKALSIV